MLDSVYNDPLLEQGWRVFDFSFSKPAVVLVRTGGKVIHTSLSDGGVPQGNVLSNNVGLVRLDGSLTRM